MKSLYGGGLGTIHGYGFFMSGAFNYQLHICYMWILGPLIQPHFPFFGLFHLFFHMDATRGNYDLGIYLPRVAHLEFLIFSLDQYMSNFL